MTETTVVEGENPVEQAAGPDLKLVDIKNAIKVIEFLTERSTVKAAELSSIGYVYDRLRAFVAHYDTQVEGEAVAAGTDEVPAAAEEPKKKAPAKKSAKK
jgi:hypothetical protein